MDAFYGQEGDHNNVAEMKCRKDVLFVFVVRTGQRKCWIIPYFQRQHSNENISRWPINSNNALSAHKYSRSRIRRTHTKSGMHATTTGKGSAYALLCYRTLSAQKCNSLTHTARRSGPTSLPQYQYAVDGVCAFVCVPFLFSIFVGF